MPLRTRREKKEAEEASGGWSREGFADGCSAVVLIPMFIIGGILAVVALFAVLLGIDVIAGWIVGLLATPPMLAMLGAGTIAFAGWGLFRMASGHAPPGTSRRDLIIAVVVLIGFAGLGVVFLLAAIAPQAGDGPRF